jgi:alpha-tubulin suppressor-like RCC1 family protein
VTPAVPVASVTLTPGAANLLPQGTIRLTATLRDASGNVLDGRQILWSTDNSAVATVNAIGTVTAISAGSAVVIAASESAADTVTIVVRTVRFGSVSAGATHTCALTTEGAAYCWGVNPFGRGDGAWTFSPVPVAVTGGLTFSALSAADTHTCALTSGGAAYCWGWNGNDYNGFGQLGDGSTTSSAVPVAVVGGLMFSAVSSGASHTCGLTAAGAAYCWGGNRFGQLGNGSTTSSAVPVAVTGGLTFLVMSAGESHTCGLASNGAAYCWGTGSALGVGDTLIGSSLVPVPVAGGLTFSALSAGVRTTCGVATDGTWYCWGAGWDRDEYGERIPALPVSLPGGPYATVSAGAHGACAVATTGAAACLDRGVFDAVPGGLTFSAVSVGRDHVCGVSSGAIAHCWRENRYGQLGNGTLISSAAPVRVAGQP